MVSAYVLNSSSGSRAYQNNYKNFQALLKLVQPFGKAMGVASQDVFDALYEQAMIEMLNPDFRSLWYFYSVWGEKRAGQDRG